MRAHRAHHVRRNRALVHGARAARRQRFERGSVFRIHDALADRLAVVHHSGARLLAQELLVLQQRIEARRERKALLRHFDRRSEELGPGEAAVALVRELEHAQHTRDTDRAATDDGVHERHGFPVAHEPLGPGRSWSCLAAVVAPKLLLALRPVQEERAAADAGGFRLDQPQHHLHRDRRIDRRAAAREHRIAGLRRERMRRRDHELPRRDRVARFGADAENKKGSRGRLFQDAIAAH